MFEGRGRRYTDRYLDTDLRDSMIEGDREGLVSNALWQRPLAQSGIFAPRYTVAASSAHCPHAATIVTSVEYE
jgi:hypothetical protein